MKISVAWVGKTKERAIQSLTIDYLKRLSHFASAESFELGSEAALLRLAGRGQRFVALDSRGKQVSSEELAQFLADHQNRGTQALLFGIGPANGWSPEALNQASAQISFGRITLPHELARVVLLEQLYRAFTILKGHPYHLGH